MVLVLSVLFVEATECLSTANDAMDARGGGNVGIWIGRGTGLDSGEVSIASDSCLGGALKSGSEDCFLCRGGGIMIGGGRPRRKLALEGGEICTTNRFSKRSSHDLTRKGLYLSSPAEFP